MTLSDLMLNMSSCLHLQMTFDFSYIYPFQSDDLWPLWPLTSECQHIGCYGYSSLSLFVLCLSVCWLTELYLVFVFDGNFTPVTHLYTCRAGVSHFRLHLHGDVTLKVNLFLVHLYRPVMIWSSNADQSHDQFAYEEEHLNASSNSDLYAVHCGMLKVFFGLVMWPVEEAETELTHSSWFYYIGLIWWFCLWDQKL